MMAVTSALNFSLGALRGAKPQRPQMPLAPGPHGAASRGHQQASAFSLFAGEPAPQGPFSIWPGPDPAPQGPFSFIRPDLPPVEGERAVRARAAPAAAVQQQDQSFSGQLSAGGKQRFRSALEQVSYLTNQSAQGLE